MNKCHRTKGAASRLTHINKTVTHLKNVRLTVAVVKNAVVPIRGTFYKEPEIAVLNQLHLTNCDLCVLRFSCEEIFTPSVTCYCK